MLEGVPLNDMERHAAVGPRSLPGPVVGFIGFRGLVFRG